MIFRLQPKLYFGNLILTMVVFWHGCGTHPGRSRSVLSSAAFCFAAPYVPCKDGQKHDADFNKIEIFNPPLAYPARSLLPGVCRVPGPTRTSHPRPVSDSRPAASANTLLWEAP